MKLVEKLSSFIDNTLPFHSAFWADSTQSFSTSQNRASPDISHSVTFRLPALSKALQPCLPLPAPNE
jgi:hypothetical protein